MYFPKCISGTNNIVKNVILSRVMLVSNLKTQRNIVYGSARIVEN